MSTEPARRLRDTTWELSLVDQHCHSVRVDNLDPTAVESLLTESRTASGGFDTQVGVALRRWCAPVLGLPAHAPVERYLDRRRELGGVEVSRRLLADANCAHLLVDTGLAAPGLADLEALASASEASVHEVVRLESVAERVAADTSGAADFLDRLATAVTDAGHDAVAYKSILAYRYGLDVEPTRPTPGETRVAVARWLDRYAGHQPRVDDPTLLRHLLWLAIDLGGPVQIHTGYGDPDLTLHRSDPLLLTDLLRATDARGVDVVLLHTYPYHRGAAYLAQVFDHVYVDVGLAVNHVGPRAAAVLAETLELAPFGALVYSSDGYGLAELHHLGAVLFRRGLAEVFGRWVADGDLDPGDARRYVTMIGSGTATRVYRL